MKKNALMPRIARVVILTLLLTAVSTNLLFSLFSREVFQKLRTADLRPRAQSFVSLVQMYLKDEMDAETLVSMANGEMSLTEARMLLIGADKSVILPEKEQAAEPLLPHADEVLCGRELSDTLRLRGGRISYVGLPVRGENGEVQAALFLYSELSGAALMQESMRSTVRSRLLMTMAIVVPSVFLFTYLLLRRLVQPLGKMRDVAVRMAEGRFDETASEKAPGEVGQLGASLNSMSRALRQSLSDLTFERNRLISILNGLSEGIAAVDRLGRVTHVNQALERIFGAGHGPDARSNLIGVPGVWTAFDKAVDSAESADFVIRLGEKDVRCLISPVYDDAGKSAGAVGLFRDVTSEVRLENTRREYVANVSHEMRTPLTAMRGLIEPLKDGMVKDEATRQRYYDIILREVLRLSRLISDIMELSRLQSGTLSIQREVFAPGEQLKDLCARYRAIAEEKGLTLEEDDLPEKLPPVLFNEDRLEQIMVILLDNAIKYTENGWIRVGAEVTPASVLIRVADSGIGIPEEQLEHVFERFFKTDKAHSGNGSGLGLSIAREVLNCMGEQIFVRSKEGEGSEFVFTVRRAPEETK